MKSTRNLGLFFSKIPYTKVEEYTGLKKKADILFNDPEKFLHRTISKNMKMYIGSRLPKVCEDIRPIEIVTEDSSPRMYRGSIFFKKKKKDSSMIQRINSFSPSNMSGSVNEGNKFFSVSDCELEAIYKSFKDKISAKSVQGNNKISIFNQNNSNLKTKKSSEEIKIDHMLDLQNKILNFKQRQNKTNERVSNFLTKKLKKSKSDLLMNRIPTYRIINEIKEKIEKKEKCYHDNNKIWQRNLRENENDHPKKILEKIRGENKGSQIDKISFLRNSYMRQRKDYSKIIGSFEELKNMSLIGKNLLESEFDIANQLKKKRICKYPSTNLSGHSSEILEDEIIIKSGSLNDLNHLKIINSSQSLHFN